MNRTIRNSLEIAASIAAINEMRPGLKETQVVPYAYKLMAQDVAGQKVDVSVWDDVLKVDFGDKEKQIDFPETRGISADDEDFEIVVGGKDAGYPAAYLNREGVTRAPLAYVTKLVLYYARLKLTKEKENEVSGEIDTNSLNGVELLSRVNAKAAELILSGCVGKIMSFLED